MGCTVKEEKDTQQTRTHIGAESHSGDQVTHGDVCSESERKDAVGGTWERQHGGTVPSVGMEAACWGPSPVFTCGQPWARHVGLCSHTGGSNRAYLTAVQSRVNICKAFTAMPGP